MSSKEMKGLESDSYWVIEYAPFEDYPSSIGEEKFDSKEEAESWAKDNITHDYYYVTLLLPYVREK